MRDKHSPPLNKHLQRCYNKPEGINLSPKQQSKTTMKLTKKTLSVLENFSSINANLVIQPGNKIRTMSPTKSLLAEVEVEETFEDTICIYDLDKFLRLYKCIENPEVTVEGGHTIHIHNDEDSIEYRLSDESVVQTPPSKELKLPSTDVEFELSHLALAKCQRVAKAMNHQHLAIVGDGETIWLKVVDKNNSGSDSFKTQVGYSNNVFTLFVKLENLRISSGYYDVTISQKNLMKLESQHENLHYFCALEPDSEWNVLENTCSVEEETVEETTTSYEEETVEEPTSYQPYKASEEVTEEELEAMVS